MKAAVTAAVFAALAVTGCGSEGDSAGPDDASSDGGHSGTDTAPRGASTRLAEKAAPAVDYGYEAATAIRRDLVAQGVSVTGVSCGYHPGLDVGDEFTCTVTARASGSDWYDTGAGATDTATAYVTATDSRGGVTWNLGG